METAASGIYNGCFFDVVAKDAPILVTAVTVAGTRGSLRVFATRAAEPQVNAMTDWRRWVAVGMMHHVPTKERPPERTMEQRSMSSTDDDWGGTLAPSRPAAGTFNTASAALETTTLHLARPVPIASGTTRGFHVHLAYTEGSRLATKEVLEPSSVLVKDVYASLLAGAGYIGFTPFFTRQADGVADGTWRDGRGLVGGVTYERAPADLDTLTAEFDAALTSLDDLAPFIGPVNLQLISEWSGVACDPPLRTLALPQPDPLAAPLPPASEAPTIGEVDALWAGHRAMAELWKQFLRSFGWGCDVWLAELRAQSAPLLAATRDATRMRMVRHLLSELEHSCTVPRHRLVRIGTHLSAGLRLGTHARRVRDVTRPLPGEPLMLRGFIPPDDTVGLDGGGGGTGSGRKLNAIQVTLNKAHAAATVGITLSDESRPTDMPRDNNAERTMAEMLLLPPPTVSGVAAGSLAEQSGAIVVGQRILAVNGVGVHGHEHGTRLLKLATGSLVLRLSLARTRSYADGHAPLASNEIVLRVRQHLRRALLVFEGQVSSGDIGLLLSSRVHDDPQVALTHLRKASALAERVLLSRVATFKHSPEYAAGCRLIRATPAPANLSSFSLIRRIGRGSFGVVYAARKEDTLALYALKMVHLTRLRRLRDEEHMRLERLTLERTAQLGSPFLSTLCYAFIEGPWLVLAMPLLSGGTLQVQLEERAERERGLPAAEVRWIGAQLSLALGALHSLELLHRDIKPSNLVLRANGYYVLTDFGLSEPPGASTKSGTRGYWAPETIRMEEQSYASDWWSAGVVLAYAAMGRHPFHQGGDGDVGLGDAHVDPEMASLNPHMADPGAMADGAAQLGGALVRAHTRNATGGQRAQARFNLKQAIKAREGALNEATLSAPIAMRGPHLTKPLESLLLQLLERDPTKRFASAADVQSHPFLGDIEWELLRQMRLPPPYTPDRKLVYAKDDVPPFSFHPETDADAARDLEQVGQRLGAWDYAVPPGSKAFADELGEYVKKFTAVSHA